jgi:hypothetical protein
MRRLLQLALTLALAGCSGSTNGGPSVDAGADVAVTFPDGPAPSCPGGVDQDGDGYGIGCPAGTDCNDSDPSMSAGTKETCDGKDNNCNNEVDEGVKNPCGTCDPGCSKLGDKPFELEPAKDPGIKDANGVGLDKNGDLVLDKTKTNFNYMWIANSLDTLGAAGGCNWANEPSYNQGNNPKCRGTVSKIDTVSLKEVARYFTVTCHSKPGQTGCLDLHGKPITAEFVHAPSRTAVDYNFDVWVANRAFGGQPSATKIANELGDCIDRNKNGKIDTSKDQDGDGKINPDCDSDGLPDGLATICTAGTLAGKPPEFVGNDDECILFTVNYGDPNDFGRSICLDTGVDIGASNAWVGTYNHPGQNRFYKIAGTSGQLTGPYNLPAGHASYGCVVDSQRILWSADFAGTMTFLNTVNPTQVGPMISPPWTPKGFYGITVDGADQIWAGGWGSGRVYRYKPNRTSFADLSAGSWMGAKHPTGFDYSRGIAADLRGKVWVAINAGYIYRLDQNLPDGEQDLTASTSYWQTAGTGVIGVGVDFAGHVWGISYSHGNASRLDVDALGDPVQPPSATTKVVPVGNNPYTYSDFTGYGLQSFTRPQGRYLYQLQPCTGSVKPTWKQVTWNATTPAGTTISVRVRSGNDEASFGDWIGPVQQSPLLLEKGAQAPLSPNPALILQVEFTLQTSAKAVTPILHDFDVAYSCTDIPG